MTRPDVPRHARPLSAGALMHPDAERLRGLRPNLITVERIVIKLTRAGKARLRALLETPARLKAER